MTVEREQVPLTRAAADAAERAMETEIARLNPELGKRAGLIVLELDATKRALEQAVRERDEERQLRRSETRDLYEEAQARLAAVPALVEKGSDFAAKVRYFTDGPGSLAELIDALDEWEAALAAYEQAQGQV